jgi:dihydroflavonol-4-reductase
VGEHSAGVEVASGAVTACVTGATGFIGAHVARLQSEAGRPARLAKGDVLDRAVPRRAFRGCDVVFHTAGYLAARPVQRVWELNALAPRLAVEAAAAEGVRRFVLTSSVAGIGPSPPGEPNTEESLYRGGGLGLTYVDAKHECENEALTAGVRLAGRAGVLGGLRVAERPLGRRLVAGR